MQTQKSALSECRNMIRFHLPSGVHQLGPERKELDPAPGLPGEDIAEWYTGRG